MESNKVTDVAKVIHEADNGKKYALTTEPNGKVSFV
jgi:hypothetical protein